MTAANRKLGTNIYVSFASQEVGTDIQSFEINQSSDMVDISAGSETNKSYLPALQDGTATMRYTYTGTAGTALTNVLRAGQGGTLIWGTEGTASGKPKGVVYAYVSQHQAPVEYNGLLVSTVNFQLSGTLISDPMSGGTWA